VSKKVTKKRSQEKKKQPWSRETLAYNPGVRKIVKRLELLNQNKGAGGKESRPQERVPDTRTRV